MERGAAVTFAFSASLTACAADDRIVAGDDYSNNIARVSPPPTRNPLLVKPG
jgi:hypothetical protein